MGVQIFTASQATTTEQTEPPTLLEVLDPTPIAWTAFTVNTNYTQPAEEATVVVNLTISEGVEAELIAAGARLFIASGGLYEVVSGGSQSALTIRRLPTAVYGHSDASTGATINAASQGIQLTFLPSISSSATFIKWHIDNSALAVSEAYSGTAADIAQLGYSAAAAPVATLLTDPTNNRQVTREGETYLLFPSDFTRWCCHGFNSSADRQLRLYVEAYTGDSRYV